MGFGYKIMYDEVPAGTKPFDEGNKLVFCDGAAYRIRRSVQFSR